MPPPRIISASSRPASRARGGRARLTPAERRRARQVLGELLLLAPWPARAVPLPPTVTDRTVEDLLGWLEAFTERAVRQLVECAGAFPEAAAPGPGKRRGPDPGAVVNRGRRGLVHQHSTSPRGSG